MATKLTQIPQITSQDVFVSSSIQQMPLGVYAETSDGRGFRYAKMGAVAAVPGKVYQGAAQGLSDDQGQRTGETQL